MVQKELLIALDFSSCAEKVAREGADLAKQLGARVCLLHVVAPTPGVGLHTRLPIHGEITAREYLQRSTEERLARFAERLGSGAAEPARVAVRFGEPATEIVGYARETAAAMIVMGTHGRTGVARALYGSIAADVVRTADVPVVTLRAQWSSECAARSCNWCEEISSPEERQVDAEQYG